MTAEDLYDFLSDPNLIELIETNKVTDDIFDVMNLVENQHSKLLAWCMNPNEGHGQGDAVIKDFLEAAYHASETPTWDNKKFFEIWTPGKIRTSSFGAAFLTREFEVVVDEDSRKGRLDLFLVDPQNKLLVTIENKAGAMLTAEQLEKYVRAVKANVASNKAFAGYQQAYVVLDRELANYSDSALAKLGKRWALLDYTWLAASAKRARHQQERESKSAQLLMAYCQRQTDWESDVEKRISDLAVDLAMAHPEVVKAMRSLEGVSIAQWRPLSGPQGELTVFLAQHRSVCERIIATRGVAIIKQQLLKRMPSLNADLIDTGRTWLAAIPAECRELIQDDADAYWPLYINLQRVAKLSRPDAPRYNLQLHWVRNEFESARLDEKALRQHFQTAFPGLATFVGSDQRRILIEEDMAENEAINASIRLLEKISACMLSRRK
ncbi:PD-(D/E)XK nuclease family protein [Massilia sp. YMA4]|uniref:PDDEXK-like family protein n=1 Tax=Massilia sp. YMA4 TaxID=1593482 RepID=UPI000DD14BBC|nr:PD-(D/E)XK nuclease family protein [Massilia sp. YMA4]AXA94847.1 hypothetical protein DPH57_21980 [Massilia sp. YMA4]